VPGALFIIGSAAAAVAIGGISQRGGHRAGLQQRVDTMWSSN